MKRPIKVPEPVDRPALDPTRVENAKRRARAALLAARHHEQLARSERAKIKVLANTWDFDVESIK